MKRIDMNHSWNFKFCQPPVSFDKKPEALLINLPHDFSIIQKRDQNLPDGTSYGFFPGGNAEYEKTIFIPSEWKGKKVILEFEGIYMNATVRFNGHIITQHPYGYTSFHCDLTTYLIFGKNNIINVNVNNSAIQNARWYSGSGIYRPVWLLVGEALNIKPWGIYAITPEVSEGFSKLVVKTDMENMGRSLAKVTLRSKLLDVNGEIVALCETDLEVPERSSLEASQTLVTDSTNLWSVEHPYLYTLKSEVVSENIIFDSTETFIGFRTISFNTKNGFMLNGVPTKLKGGNVHQDCGLLGAASYSRAEERKVELLKASGYNAVRCAHNPPSPSFLDACDRLGMLVIDEAFDGWREGKRQNDYNLYFDDWWKRDMASMVLRDRNHPSIIMWSTGNENVERDGRSDGYAYARMLADYIRSLDNARAITNALCATWDNPLLSALGIDISEMPEGFDYWGKVTEKFAEPLDVVGYNYLLDRYESDGEKYPNRIICGTETYPKEIFEYWDKVERLPYVIGDFVWTSMDYFGESGLGHIWHNGEKDWLGRYPWHQAFCGDIDICGFKRPQSYYRDCVWGISASPYIAVYRPEYYGKEADISLWGWPDVVASWTWPGFEGKPIVVEIYSTADEIELILNGNLLGRKPSGKGSQYKTLFEFNYTAGELTAVGYTAGVEVSRSSLKTAGPAAAIKLLPDRDCLNRTFGDLSFVTVELVDVQGNVVHNASNNIFFTVYGAGKLLAVGSSNPISEEMYTGNQRKLHEGRVMAVVLANGDAGDIILSAIADGIPDSKVTIHVKEG